MNANLIGTVVLLVLVALLCHGYLTWRIANAPRWVRTTRRPAAAFWCMGEVATRAEMLAVNSQDPAFCAWLGSAQVGDSYVDSWQCVHVAIGETK